MREVSVKIMHLWVADQLKVIYNKKRRQYVLKGEEKVNKGLSKSEMEIMRKLWEYTDEISPRELLDFFNRKGKDWKRQTLNTLLTRMEEKGMIARQRGMIRVLCSEEQYREQESRRMVNDFFDGKLSQFMASFAGSNVLTKEEIKALEELIGKLKQEGE